MRDEVIRIIEKSRIEENPTGGNPFKETWKEIDGNPEKVSEEMADFIWHEHGIDVEEKGIEVVDNE